MKRTQKTPSACVDSRLNRRGITALWLILALPVFMTLFCFVVDIANVWLARVELKAALDAASLGSVKTWADTADDMDPSDTLLARNIGVEFALANTVAGSPLVITTNFVPGGIPNQNIACDLADNAHLIFGAIDTSDVSNITFSAGVRPNCADGELRQFGVRAQATASVPSICSAWFGIPVGPYSVTAISDALYDCAEGTPRLTQIHQYSCP